MTSLLARLAGRLKKLEVNLLLVDEKESFLSLFVWGASNLRLSLKQVAKASSERTYEQAEHSSPTTMHENDNDDGDCD